MHVMASKGVCRSTRPAGQCRQALGDGFWYGMGPDAAVCMCPTAAPLKRTRGSGSRLPRRPFWASPPGPLGGPEVRRSSRGLDLRPARYPSSQLRNKNPPATSRHAARIRPVNDDAPLCFPLTRPGPHNTAVSTSCAAAQSAPFPWRRVSWAVNILGATRVGLGPPPSTTRFPAQPPL